MPLVAALKLIVSFSNVAVPPWIRAAPTLPVAPFTTKSERRTVTAAACDQRPPPLIAALNWKFEWSMTAETQQERQAAARAGWSSSCAAGAVAAQGHLVELEVDVERGDAGAVLLGANQLAASKDQVVELEWDLDWVAPGEDQPEVGSAGSSRALNRGSVAVDRERLGDDRQAGVVAAGRCRRCGHRVRTARREFDRVGRRRPVRGVDRGHDPRSAGGAGDGNAGGGSARGADQRNDDDRSRKKHSTAASSHVHSVIPRSIRVTRVLQASTGGWSLRSYTGTSCIPAGNRRTLIFL